MPPEIALVESRALRASVAHRVEALDKVKALIMLPDGTYVTTQMVADYFEVGNHAINTLIQRHRKELEDNGFRILKGVDMSHFVNFNLKSTQVSGRGIAIYARRTVLNVAMLLRDSTVAQRVRAYLLDVEERVVHSPVPEPGPTPQARPYGMPPGRRLGPGPHWDEYQVTSTDPAAEAWRQVIDGEAAAPAAPGHHVTREWTESVDRRLDSMGRVSSALSRKLDDMGEDVRDMRRDIHSLRDDVAQVTPPRSRREPDRRG
jgi:hypothetical protein